ncbi:MAG: penicillin-binding protein 2 [Oculatellaceae cyanobacterium Prado106]|jgi:penicillin-binding protein 2|nr:penicillin-binding protein 2 [Oculatellaceae cyanobacterium Prado106]
MAIGISRSSNKRSSHTSLVKGAAGREKLMWRSAIFMFGITTFMGVCVFRLAQLQIVQGHRNYVLAEQNRVRPIPLPADRGNIRDRNGKLLATNQLSHGLYLWPRQQSPEEWKQTADRLSPILGIPATEIISKIEAAKGGYNSVMPVPISQQISPTAFVALAEQEDQFHGVEVFAGSTRSYPNKGLAAHVLGYIGEAREDDMKANPDYPNGMIVGQMGVERLANAQLEGKWGSRRVEVDAGGKETRFLGIEQAVGGTDVKLTLDLDMQKAAEKALGGRRGAVVAMNVNTGAVLVLASSPTFDPGVFTGRVSDADWKRLQEGDQPFLNRALQGYPPGSTFKIVTAAAGIESGNFTPNSTIMTSSFISLGGIQFWEHSGGYGVIGFHDALAFSSNTFFYQVGLKTGPEEISKWGSKLGIGTTTLGLEGESHGAIPTPENKEKLYGEPWYGGDTVSTSIGQGLVQATPMELAVMTAAIANNGWHVHPHLLMSETAAAEKKKTATGLAPETLKVIQEGLVAVVQRGTGQRLNDGSIPLTAGKTGTSEVGPGRTPNAMYVGYGPASKPEIAIAVAIENGGYGGVAALPVAHEIYKVYFNRNKK